MVRNCEFMKKFFYLKEGQNKLKLLTVPYKAAYHIHNKQIKMCFKSNFKCEFCLNGINSFNYISSVGTFIGIKLKNDDNKYVWHVQNRAISQLYNISNKHGDPIQFEYNIRKKGNHIQVNKLNRIENFEDKNMSQRIDKATDAMFLWLKKSHHQQELKNIYQICYNDSQQLVDELYNTVEKYFPQNLDTLKTLLLFS